MSKLPAETARGRRGYGRHCGYVLRVMRCVLITVVRTEHTELATERCKRVGDPNEQLV